MDGDIRRVVQRQDTVFTKEALQAQDGKVVPLTLEPGGPVIGKATLKYVEEDEALVAHFHVDDPKVADVLREDPPNIFSQGETHGC